MTRKISDHGGLAKDSLPISRNPADGAKSGGGGNRTREPIPTECARKQGFFFKTQIAGIELNVSRDGKHVNLHALLESALDTTPSIWNFEPLDQVIPKLEALLTAAHIAQEAAHA